MMEEKAIIPKVWVTISLVLSIMLLSSCSTFQGLAGKAKIRRPQVDFAGAKLSGLSFDAVDLLFDLRIRNPNSLGLKMAGFDYDFLINDTSFLKGKQAEKLEIEARGESTIHFPLSLRFVDLYQTFQNLLSRDVSTYQLDCGFSFDVPVLGVVNVPVSKKGEFPLLKIPKVNVAALKLKSLTLSGAELELGVRLNNPNAFSMILERFQYRFEVNGLRWVSGDAREGTQIGEKGESHIQIPIYLDLFQMGRSVYQLLTGDENLSYEFGGRLDLVTSVPLLDQISFPFDRSGRVKVLR